MEVSVKPHPGRTAQIEITRQQMGHGMPDTGSESWNIHPGCLSSNTPFSPRGLQRKVCCVQSVPSCFEKRGFYLLLGGSCLKHCLGALGACSSTKIWVLGALRLIAMQSER